MGGWRSYRSCLAVVVIGVSVVVVVIGVSVVVVVIGVIVGIVVIGVSVVVVVVSDIGICSKIVEYCCGINYIFKHVHIMLVYPEIAQNIDFKS